MIREDHKQLVPHLPYTVNITIFIIPPYYDHLARHTQHYVCHTSQPWVTTSQP